MCTNGKYKSLCFLNRFHYDFIKRRYGDSAHLLFTDTDSLMYELETDDAYKEMWDYREFFDLAGYPKENRYYDPTNNKVPCTHVANPYFKTSFQSKCIP